VEPPDAVTIYRTYRVISQYQNQFPALAWTCENMEAPSEPSLEPPIYHDSINPPKSFHLKREPPGTSGGAAYRKGRKRDGVRR